MSLRNVKSDVSIIIPSYNCAKYLEEAISSCLAQSRPAREVIVINDGSTDSTDDVVEPYLAQITYIKQPNRGVAYARNQGIARSLGYWLLFLDADDRLERKALQSLLTGGDASRDCVVYGDKYQISEGGKILGIGRHLDCAGPEPRAARASFSGALFEPGAALVPRWLAHELEGFDQRYAPCEDRHFWIRCGAMVPFRHVSEIVFHYRDRPGSHSKNRVRQAVASVRVRIDALAWCAQRGIQLLEQEAEPASILASELTQTFWRRNWQAVDALLEFASEQQISSVEIERLRQRRKYPRCLYWLKDGMDCLMNSMALLR